MDSHTRNIYRSICLTAGALAILLWLLWSRFEWILPLPVSMTFLGVAMGWAWLMHPRPAATELPDLLGEMVGTYFEREGLCFAPRLIVEDRVCRFQTVIQN